MTSSFISRIKLNNLLFIIIISSIFLSTNSQQPTRIISSRYSRDIGTYNFHHDQVPSNVNKVITQLKSESSTTYFSSNSTNVGRNNKFVVFFSCRYDVSLRACQSCVATAVEDIYSSLPGIQSYTVFEECIVGHSNNSNHENDVMSGMGVHNERHPPLKETDEGAFRQILHDTVSELINNVILEFNESSRYFAMTTAKYSSRETLYALAQCNPYIRSSNCSACLEDCFSFIGSQPAGIIYDYGQFFRSSRCRLSYIFSTKVLSRPWNFKLTDDEIHMTSIGTPRSSIYSALVATISSVVLTLKLFLL